MEKAKLTKAQSDYQKAVDAYSNAKDQEDRDRLHALLSEAQDVLLKERVAEGNKPPKK